MGVDVTFDEVTSPGDTQVTTTSNAAGSIPFNFAIQLGTWRAVFADVTTTAGYTPPITTCITYPDSAPPDGIVDGTEPGGGVSECDMRLLHKEGTGFQDVTLLANDSACPVLAGTCLVTAPRCIDTVSNKICGVTDSLSPFLVAAISPPPVPALSPHGVVALGAVLALAGAALLGVQSRSRRRHLK